MRLFHCLAALSTIAASGTAVVAAAPADSLYYGRWTVAEARPVFTPRGREYKTFDLAPCGDDFCAVSVGDGGRCGAVLFRFLGHRARNDAEGYLQGHAKWGNARKNVVIYADDTSDKPITRQLNLFVGDGYDFGERGGSMPKFHSEYKRVAAARCTAR